MTERITCPRCGNANAPHADKCLACGRQHNAGLNMVASRDLNPRDFELFSVGIRNDMERARRSLNRARMDAALAEESAQFWLNSLNATKRYALKHGIDLDG